MKGDELHNSPPLSFVRVKKCRQRSVWIINRRSLVRICILVWWHVTFQTSGLFLSGLFKCASRIWCICDWNTIIQIINCELGNGRVSFPFKTKSGDIWSVISKLAKLVEWNMVSSTNRKKQDDFCIFVLFLTVSCFIYLFVFTCVSQGCKQGVSLRRCFTSRLHMENSRGKLRFILGILKSHLLDYYHSKNYCAE